MGRELIYSMGVSLDGFIADREGGIAWAAPGEELHRFHNRQAAETGIHLYGRRLYETMLFWEELDVESSLGEVEREFARIWKATPKLIFSTTLREVEGNASLAAGEVGAEVERLKREDGKDLAVGGAGLATSLVERDLVDEYRLFVSPLILGGGTPFFPPLKRPLALALVETREFAGGVVFQRYRRRA